MSVKRPSPLADHDFGNLNLSTKKLPVSEQEPVDQRLKQLKEDVLPFYPFLLTVPTDVPFRLGNRFVNDWSVGKDGPFTPEEHQLQYMTFLTHHEGDSLLVAVGDWSDEAGNIMMDQHPVPQNAASPPGGLAKKRITLSDYKNKRKNGTPVPADDDAGSRGASTPHEIGQKQQVSKSNSPGSSARNRLDNTPSARTASVNSGRKHPYEPNERSKSPNGRHSEIPSKRRRLSPESESRHESPHQKSNKLPALLSPTLPPTSGRSKLPRLLSPTLPPDIEKDLAGIDREPSQSRNASAPKAVKSDAPRSRSPRNKTLHPDRAHDSSGVHNSRGRSPTDRRPSGVDHVDDSSPEVSRAVKPSHKVENSSNASPANFKANRHPSPVRRPSLILKLKYGRSNRKRVEGLLKFSGKKKLAQPSPSSREHGDHKIPQAKKENRDSSRLDREPRHGTGNGRERSREVKASTSEKPQTPASVQPSSDGKPKQPSAKDLRGPTPHRTESAEVPRASKDSGTAAKPSPHSPQKARSQDNERRAWKDEFQRFSNLGRELKHAAERQTAKDGTTSIDEKRAVATAIEAILCFILAFVAEDQSKALARQAGESSNWLSILAYWRVVRKNSNPYPPLRSLCYILGAVSYDSIHALDLERLAVSPVPGEHMAAPTPGSDGDTVVSDEGRKTMKEFLELKNRLPECYKESQRLWLEGSRGLSEDILSADFPSTWSKRSRNYSERGNQNLKVGDYSGEFFLPLERTSVPVEAVRFAYSILNEWCAKEGVDWRGRLGL